jgi:opacity protein-like surface antigen
MLLVIIGKEKANAQFTPSKYEAGINIGSLIYQGDLSAGALGYTRSLKPAIGLYVARALDDYFSLRANLDFGSIEASDAAYSSPEYRRFRDFSFKSSVVELSGMLVWHPLGNTYANSDSRFSPYLFAGLGASFLHISRNWSGMDIPYFGGQSPAVAGLGADTLHRLPKVIPVLPVGVGVQYIVSPRIAVNAEWTYRLTATDYLDGFKYSTDAKKNDYYYGFTVGVSYRFGNNKMDCPKVPK